MASRFSDQSQAGPPQSTQSRLFADPISRSDNAMPCAVGGLGAVSVFPEVGPVLRRFRLPLVGLRNLPASFIRMRPIRFPPLSFGNLSLSVLTQWPSCAHDCPRALTCSDTAAYSGFLALASKVSFKADELGPRCGHDRRLRLVVQGGVPGELVVATGGIGGSGLQLARLPVLRGEPELVAVLPGESTWSTPPGSGPGCTSGTGAGRWGRRVPP